MGYQKTLNLTFKYFFALVFSSRFTGILLSKWNGNENKNNNKYKQNFIPFVTISNEYQSYSYHKVYILRIGRKRQIHALICLCHRQKNSLGQESVYKLNGLFIYKNLIFFFLFIARFNRLRRMPQCIYNLIDNIRFTYTFYWFILYILMCLCWISLFVYLFVYINVYM